MQLLINSSGTALNVRNGCFFIQNETTERMVSPLRLSSIAISNKCSISTQAIQLAATQQVPIFVINNVGKTVAQFWSASLSNHTSIRRQQVIFKDTPDATRVIISWLKLKCVNQKHLLQSYCKEKLSENFVVDAIIALTDAVNQLTKHTDSQLSDCGNNLMGIEGSVSKRYFETLSKLVPEMYHFNGRSRMPATDMFNAMLNYLYGMLYGITENALLAAGLDPCFGLLHADGYDTPALSFDFIEPFRPWADELIVSLCLQHVPKKDWFEIKNNTFRLNSKGKKELIPAFNQFLHTRIKFDKKFTTRYNLIYRLAQHFAARLLERNQN